MIGQSSFSRIGVRLGFVAPGTFHPSADHAAGRMAAARAVADFSDGVHLSTTHVDGGALAAASRRWPVGVDLERSGRAVAAHLRYFATRSESAAVPDPTTLWTIKEAAWKLVGGSPDLAFSELRLRFSNDRLVGIEFRGERWWARAVMWTPWPAYVATLVRGHRGMQG